MSNITSQMKRARRKARSRAQIHGTAMRPRLAVFRSLRGVYAQLINDDAGTTLVSAYSKTDTAGDAGERTGKVAAAYRVGLSIAAKAKEAGVQSIVFDRSGYKYHGRVQAVAEGARDGGLEF
jgi:large subunit ribosomal protein L18